MLHPCWSEVFLRFSEATGAKFRQKSLRGNFLYSRSTINYKTENNPHVFCYKLNVNEFKIYFKQLYGILRSAWTLFYLCNL